jgi:hypothetical protein
LRQKENGLAISRLPALNCSVYRRATEWSALKTSVDTVSISCPSETPHGTEQGT